MTKTPPTLLPVSKILTGGSASFTTSFAPASPTAILSNNHLRSPSPSRIRRNSHPPPRYNIQRPHLPRRLSHYVHLLLSPRILSPLLLWSLAIYLVHLYLLPIPIFSIFHRTSRSSASDHLLSTVFPAPPQREGDDTLESGDPRWRAISPLPPPEAPFPRLRPTRFLPPRCLEQWFADGETLCGSELGPEEKLDATWLWVNGSDTRWRASMVQAREKAGVYSPEHHFREQNELVHSMRSVLDALPGHLRTFHLITADFAFRLPEDLSLLPQQVLPILEELVDPGEPVSNKPMYNPVNTKPNAGGPLGELISSDISLDAIHSLPSVSKALASHLAKNWRVTQTPIWLNYSQRDPAAESHPFHQAGRPLTNPAERNYPNLRYAIHSEIFHLPTLDRDGLTESLGEREWREKEWRSKALPSFNSMAIESRVGWLPGLADVSISLNDDFFLLKPHAVADFHSPLYGSVIRFDHGYLSQVRPVLDKSRFNDAGEMGGLWHANWLLSRRFPRRLRPYFAHVPKTVTRGLHHEASIMFREALTGSSERNFREMSINDGDIQMQWLLTSLRVERWREALLWTYVVANIGTLTSTGEWGGDAREEIEYLFGLGEGDEDVAKIEVYRGERWTLEQGRIEKAFEQAGWEPPKATEILFSSLDGHMPPLLRPSQSESENDKCILDLDRCFGSFWTRRENTTAGDMFKRLTFHHPECGDCLIMALVTSSGPLGLSAFFPDKETSFINPPLSPGERLPKYLPPPHLPLTSTWQDADFSLESVMQATSLPGETVNLRQYCMKLLSRYLYLSGKSVSHFHMLKGAEHAERVFNMIEGDSRVSILGLNDDIVSDYDVVKTIMNGWFEFRWPRKAVWEKDWDPVKDKIPT